MGVRDKPPPIKPKDPPPNQPPGAPIKSLPPKKTIPPAKGGDSNG